MGQAASHVRLMRVHVRERGSVCVGGRERESGWDGDHAHGSQRAASVAEGALTGTHRIDPLQCARGIRRRRRPWISIVRGGYHRVTDLTSGRSDYGASVGILASQLLRHCATKPALNAGRAWV